MNVLIDIPWAPIVTLLLAIIGFIGWLVRLETRASTNSRDIDVERASRKENDKDLGEKIALTNTRVGLAETQINELRVTSISRDDLREVEGRLTKSIDGVGDRMSAEVDRLLGVFPKPVTRASRKKPTEVSE